MNLCSISPKDPGQQFAFQALFGTDDDGTVKLPAPYTSYLTPDGQSRPVSDIQRPVLQKFCQGPDGDVSWPTDVSKKLTIAHHDDLHSHLGSIVK